MKIKKKKPGIGDIVLYHHPRADRKHNPLAASAAIIRGVNADGSCELFVFYEHAFFFTGVIQGNGPGQWSRIERA